MPNSIRGLVFSRYDSISEFADAMKWGRQKASRIVKGTHRPSADDMEKLAEHFGIRDAGTFMTVFFPHYATM